MIGAYIAAASAPASINPAIAGCQRTGPFPFSLPQSAIPPRSENAPPPGTPS